MTGAMPATQSTADVTGLATDMLRLSADTPGLMLQTRDSMASMIDGRQCGIRMQWNPEGTPDAQEPSTGMTGSRDSGMATETQGRATDLKGEL